VITSPYGRVFADLLRSRGTVVHDIAAPNDRPIRVQEVADALTRWPGIGAIAVVHAESLTGIVNPLPEILELAAAHGALTVVDAVASAGAEPLDIDALGIDVCVVGPQKGWGGPVGVSVLTVSDRAWTSMRSNPASVRNSVLSLLDIRERWLEPGRRRVIGTPPPLELTALEAALDRLEREGIDAVVERHRIAGHAVRDGLQAMGLSLWVADERDACSVATPVRMPDGIDSADVLRRLREVYGLELTPGTGDLTGVAVRVDHMGINASLLYSVSALAALGSALRDLGARVDLGAGVEAVSDAFRALASPAPAP